MPQPTKGPRFGGSPAHQRIILANLATQLFEHGKITTTEAKAKRVQPLAERLISKAKRGDLHNRRQVLATVTDKRSAPKVPVGAEPAAESTSANSAIMATEIATQRLRSAMRASVPAVARMRFPALLVIARPSG